MSNTQTITREYIENMIQNSDLWLVRGVLAIYKFQTKFEKSVQYTNETNKVGFNKPDSSFLSSIAERIISFHRTSDVKQYRNGCLSEKQKYVTRKKMIKYCGQLLKIANHTI